MDYIGTAMRTESNATDKKGNDVSVNDAVLLLKRTKSESQGSGATLRDTTDKKDTVKATTHVDKPCVSEFDDHNDVRKGEISESVDSIVDSRIKNDSDISNANAPITEVDGDGNDLKDTRRFEENRNTSNAEMRGKAARGEQLQNIKLLTSSESQGPRA
eukprot:scaffold543089_cov51-Attheya_sp.AAC.1